MKSTIKFLGLLLMSALLLTSCEEDEAMDTNSKLEGTYKGKFMSNKTIETETVIFQNNGVFHMNLKSANTTSSIKGRYTYNVTTRSGVIQHENNTTEDFTCTNGEIHIGNNIYCNHADHKDGHHNNHLAGNHHENHKGNHKGNHNENHKNHKNHKGNHHN